MTYVEWHRENRRHLGELLPEALVVVPVGATEQHGPHLATGTDWIVAQTVAERAVIGAHDRCGLPLILAPAVPFGASEHHLRFGGTLSLTPETFQAVLLDLTRSIAVCGGRRVVLVNGHGGNVGCCQTVAAAAAERYELAVAHIDYWRLAEPPPGVPVPGHAGAFETSLVAALGGLAADGATAARDEDPVVPQVSGADIHHSAIWRDLDGYTDHPELADPVAGQAWLDQLVIALSGRLIDLSEAL